MFYLLQQQKLKIIVFVVTVFVDKKILIVIAGNLGSRDTNSYTHLEVQKAS